MREEDAGQQEVDGQSCGARGVGHEQAGEKLPALVRQGPGRGERGHVAAEADDQRQHRATVQADGAHRPIGHERRASEVPTALEHPDRHEHHRHQRHECQHRPDAGEQPVHRQALDPTAAQADDAEGRPDAAGGGTGDDAGDERHQRRRDPGDQLEQRPHDCEEDRYPHPGIEQDAIDAVGPGPSGRGRSDQVSGRVLDPLEQPLGLLERPLGLLELRRELLDPAAGDVPRADAARVARLVESAGHCLAESGHPGTCPRVDRHDRHADRRLESDRLDDDAVIGRPVHHGQRRDDGAARLGRLRQQVQRTRHAGGVDHHNDDEAGRRIRAPAGPASAGRTHRICPRDGVGGDLLVRRPRKQAVGARKINHLGGAVDRRPEPDLELDRCPRRIDDPLVRAGHGVEEGGLADVRVAEQQDARGDVDRTGSNRARAQRTRAQRTRAQRTRAQRTQGSAGGAAVAVRHDGATSTSTHAAVAPSRASRPAPVAMSRPPNAARWITRTVPPGRNPISRIRRAASASKRTARIRRSVSSGQSLSVTASA